jgi:hypothetical protein
LASLRRLRALPWAIALEGAVVANRHWKQLDEGERSRLTRLISKSRGVPTNLSERERAEIRKLVGKLDVVGMGRDLLPFTGRPRPRR